jgi:hypothetical protein
MKKLLLTTCACIPLMWVGHAQAAPSYCTGTTMTVADGSSVAGSFLLSGTGSSGNCVEAADKIFGAFSVNGAITGAGSSVFTFAMPFAGAVTIGFQGSVAQSSTGGVDYTVAIDPALSGGFLIHDLEKDVTFNSVGTPGLVTLTGTGTPLNVSATNPALNFNCTRHFPATGDTCPETLDLAELTTQLAVTQTVTTNTNTIATGLTDTISQQIPGVPEPTSLAILGSALLLFGWVYRRADQNQ